MILFIGLIPAHYRICETNQYTGHEYCTPHQILSFALIKLGKFIDASGAAITALATIAIAAFTWTLKKATDRLWDAGEKQLRHIEASSKHELRAYLHVNDVIISLMNTEYNPNIQVIIQNYGQTPARKMLHTYRCEAMDRPRERDFTLDNVIPHELADLGPTQHVYSTTSYPIERWAEEKAFVRDRIKSFFVFGRIDYFDAFDEPRWTKYRFRLLIDADGIKDEDTSLVMDGHAGNQSI